MCDCQKRKSDATASLETASTPYEEVGAVAQMQNEVERLGRQAYRRRISSAARKALATLPDSEEVDKLDPISKQFVERISALICESVDPSRLTPSRLESYAAELAWGRMAASIAAAAMAKDNGGGGGGGGETCVTKCANEYQQCVDENDCDTGGWICACCVPCSLQYMGCVAGCVTFGGGFGGVVIV